MQVLFNEVPIEKLSDLQLVKAIRNSNTNESLSTLIEHGLYDSAIAIIDRVFEEIEKRELPEKELVKEITDTELFKYIERKKMEKTLGTSLGVRV